MNAIVDTETFSQLLEVDDFEFAKGIVDDFFVQANDSLPRFDSLLREKDWQEIAKLGHHLKGSSAAVGAANVRDICDQLQHYDMFTRGKDPSIYLRRKIENLKEAIPIAKEHLERHLADAAPP